MMPAANQGVGMNTGFPDVCTTPAAPSPIPVPYPNIGMNAMAVPFIPNIMVSMAPAQNMGAKPALTNGDNAGVAHPLFMQPGGTTMGNPRIMMGGMPAAHLAVPTYGNNFNNPVGSKLVPSVTNVLLGYREHATSPRSGTLGPLHHEAGSAWLAPRRILVLRIPCIALKTDEWLVQQLRRFSRSSLRGIVLDLRSNPGGAVVVAHSMIATLTERNLPLACAVDGQTASAAELLAASLQDLGEARVFGTRTYGKTTAAWLPTTRPATPPTHPERRFMVRPGGGRLDPDGITPDDWQSGERAAHAAERWILRGLSR